jgi:hypothetical protein
MVFRGGEQSPPKGKTMEAGSEVTLVSEDICPECKGAAIELSVCRGEGIKDLFQSVCWCALGACDCGLWRSGCTCV